MFFIRNRGAIAAVITIVLLALPLAPVSASPWGSESPAEAEESLAGQLWDWLVRLLGGDSFDGGATLTASSCTAITTSRGCAIDPNGGGSY
jgi:hypothetical protein